MKVVIQLRKILYKIYFKETLKLIINHYVQMQKYMLKLFCDAWLDTQMYQFRNKASFCWSSLSFIFCHVTF